MERTEIESKVTKVLADQLAVDAERVTSGARFEEDLDADSLDLVEAVMVLEEELGVKIDDDEMADVKTVGDAVDLVVTKMGAGASA